jgi:ABC-type uncharacterized transport system involved in gliding motility auxiliary subunit
VEVIPTIVSLRARVEEIRLSEVKRTLTRFPDASPEQRAAIDAARKDIVDTRQQLRAVQYDLNRDISRLETELRVFNIVLVPVLVAMVAIVLGIARNRRRARARA